MTVYGYDAAGNETAHIRKQAETLAMIDQVINRWDTEGRLVAVELDDNADGLADREVQYEYADDGLRTSRTENGVTTRHVVDRSLPYGQVVAEYVIDAAGHAVLQARYLFGHQWIAQERFDASGSGSGGGSSTGAPIVSLFLHDFHSGVRALADTTGTVTDRYTYDAFGIVIDQAFSGAQPTTNWHLYRGEVRDAATGDDYLRARWLRTSIARLLSEDPYGGSTQLPYSRHRYLYAHNSPVTFSDPTGQFDGLAGITVTAAVQGALAGSVIGAGLGSAYGAAKYRTAEAALYGAVVGGFAGALGGAFQAGSVAYVGVLWAGQAGISVVTGIQAAAVVLGIPEGIAASMYLGAAIATGDTIDVTFASIGFVGANYAGPVAYVAHAVRGRMPRRVARVISADLYSSDGSLGKAGSESVLVTGAADIATASSAEQISQRLTLLEGGQPQKGPFVIVEFDADGIKAAPIIEAQSPWEGFKPGGMTIGQAREYQIKNRSIKALKNVSVRTVQ